MIKKISLLALLSLFVISCNNADDGGPVDTILGEFDRGIIVSNEGNFQTPNASVSFIDKGLEGIKNNIYAAKNNNEKIGDVLQNIGFDGDKAFLVVNNSNKIIVVNRYSFKKLDTITTKVEKPRYVAFANNKAFVSSMSSKTIEVFKTSDYSHTGTVELDRTAELMKEVNGKIIAQKASWGSGNSIAIIDPSSLSLTNLEIGEGLSGIVVTDNDKLFAITSGNNVSKLHEIDAVNATIKKTVALDGIEKVGKVAADDDDVYFTSKNNVYKMDDDETTFNNKVVATVPDNSWSTFYGFGVIDGKIFTSDANGFTASSTIRVFNEKGEQTKEFKAEIGANGFYKNN